MVGLALLAAGCGALPKLAPEPSALPTETALPTPTPSFDSLMAAGQAAAAEGEWGAALDFYERAIALDVTQPRSYLLRGQVRAQLGDPAGAISDYDLALSLDSSSAETFNARALAHAQGGDGAAALADFAQALQLQPDFALVFRNRAEVQRELGDYEAAILDLEHYLKLLANVPERAWLEKQIAELEGLLTPQRGEDDLLFADDFSDPASGWYPNGDPAAIAEYAEGGYVVGHSEANKAAWALPGVLFGDIRIEVTTAKLGGDDDNYFGVLCRAGLGTGPIDFYVMMISSDGFYGIGKRVVGGDLTLIGQNKLQFSSFIRQGGESNLIVAECVGNQLRLSVNGELLVEVEDSDLSGGQIGFFAGTQEIPGTRIRFSDLAVYAVGD